MSFETATIKCDRCGHKETILDLENTPPIFFPFQLTVSHPSAPISVVGHMCQDCVMSGAPLFGNIPKLEIPDVVPRSLRG